MFKYVFLCVFVITFTVASLPRHTTKFHLYNDNGKLECDREGEGIEYLEKGEDIDIYVGLGSDGRISCIKQAWCYNGKILTANQYFNTSRSTSLKVENLSDTHRYGTWKCGFKVSANIAGKVEDVDVSCEVEYRLSLPTPLPPDTNDKTSSTKTTTTTTPVYSRTNGTTDSKVPVLNITGPNIRIRKTQENKDTVTTYGLDYTYGKTGYYDINVTCGFDTNNDNFNFELYVVILKNIPDQKTRKAGVSSLNRTFRLKEQHTKIICIATHRTNSSLKIQSMVFLKYIPSPRLTITGRNLKEEPCDENEWQRQYSLDFTDNSQLSLRCTLKLSTTIGYTLHYDIVYQNSKTLYREPGETENTKGSLSTKYEIKELNKDYDKITCVATNDPKDSIFPQKLVSTVQLKYSPAPKLSMSGSGLVPGPNANETVPVYTLTYTDDKKITLQCSLENRTDYKLRFQITAKNGGSYPLSGSNDTIRNGVSKKLLVNKPADIEYITCEANNSDKNSIFPKTLSSQVYLIHTLSSASSSVNLKVEGIVEKITCEQVKENNASTTCDYIYGDNNVGEEFNLSCFYTGGSKDGKRLIFDEDGKTAVDKTVKKEEKITTTTKLTENNKTVTCSVVLETDVLNVPIATYKIHFIYKYIQPTAKPPSDEDYKPTPNPIADSSESQDTNKHKPGKLWLYVVAVGSVILILLIILGILLFCRKKPQPDDSNYANVSRQQVNYQTKPVAAPRTLTKPNPKDQKPNVGTKPTTTKQKAVLQSTYSEPKDSTDVSEALYADPNRLVGESATYAQPYVKSDTYAEPYVAGSDVTYAELYQDRDLYSTPDKSQKSGPQVDLYATVGSKVPGKDLYATPVPKAQRTTLVKEDEYTNIFKGMYGNTKK